MRLLWLVLLCMLSTSAWAQSYEDLASQAGQLMQQFKLDKEKGVKTAWDQKDKAFQAALVWMQAAEVAADDRRRFEAYRQAGEAYQASSSLQTEQVKAYTAARGIASIPETERAEVALKAARSSHKREDYQFVVDLAKATPQQKAESFNQIGLSYITAAKDDPALNEKRVEYGLLAAAEMTKFDVQKADTELGRASVNAINVPDQARAVALIRQVYKARTELSHNDPKKIGAGMRQMALGRDYAKVKADDLAVAEWRSVGGNASYTEDQRWDAWVAAADNLSARKKFDDALTALNEAIALRPNHFVFCKQMVDKRVAIFDATSRPAESISELTKLSKHRAAKPFEREKVQLDLAQRLYAAGRAAEAEEVLRQVAAAPAQGGLSLVEVAQLRANDLARRNDLPGARKVIDEALATSLTPELRYRLEMLSANLFLLQKEYAKAFAIGSSVSQIYDGTHRPNDQVTLLVFQALKGAVADGKLDQAQTIHNETQAGWVFPAIMADLLQARYAVAVKAFPEARAAVTSARQRLNAYTGTVLEYLEKEVKEIERELQ